jgi:ketosteroid isomerase-like protein
MTEKDGVEQLLFRFAEAVDRRQADQAAAQFAADGTFNPRGAPVVGRDAIRAMYEARMSDPGRKTRHVWSNLRCEPSADGAVAFRATLTLYAFEPQVSQAALQMRIGDVEGLCKRGEGDGWVFATHIYQPVFKGELPLELSPPQSV